MLAGYAKFVICAIVLEDNGLLSAILPTMDCATAYGGIKLGAQVEGKQDVDNLKTELHFIKRIYLNI